MFSTVYAELAERQLTSQRNVILIKSLEEAAQGPTASACKGLAFVQLYATYEYAVRAAVQATLIVLRAAGVEIRTLRRDLLALVLDSHWDSASSSGRPRVWESRMALIAHVDSREPTSILRDDLFPSDGSHYRINQLRTIWRIFCVNAPIVPEPRLRGRIEELVENRNAVSHGRRRPEEVGARYSWQDIAKRAEDTDTISHHIVSTLESHVNAGGCFASATGS